MAPRIPDGAIVAYRLALRRLADKFAAKVRAATKHRLGDFALRSDSIEEDASEALDGATFSTGTVFQASSGVFEKVHRNSKAEFKRIGIKLHDEPDFAKLTADWRKDAANRVEKILARERDTIVQLLTDSEDRTPEELQDRIDDRLEVTKSKLDSAAHDDVLTLNGQLTQARQVSAGVTQFVWTTTGDERVRDSHAELDGQTCDWDDPPITNDAGDTNIPGEDYGCRCTAFPVLEELDGSDEGDDAPAEDDEAA